MSVESPCIRICTVDARAQVCIGCFRTLTEISYWTRMSDGQRAAVNGELAARRREFEAASGWARVACQRCGTEFSCGAADDTRPCWCTGYPEAAPSGTASCLCPACLSSAIGT